VARFWPQWRCQSLPYRRCACPLYWFSAKSLLGPHTQARFCDRSPKSRPNHARLQTALVPMSVPTSYFVVILLYDDIDVVLTKIWYDYTECWNERDVTSGRTTYRSNRRQASPLLQTIPSFFEDTMQTESITMGLSNTMECIKQAHYRRRKSYQRSPVSASELHWKKVRRSSSSALRVNQPSCLPVSSVYPWPLHRTSAHASTFRIQTKNKQYRYILPAELGLPMS
jgi:hypothetical protein